MSRKISAIAKSMIKGVERAAFCVELLYFSFQNFILKETLPLGKIILKIFNFQGLEFF
jgi:hypothetical protein